MGKCKNCKYFRKLDNTVFGECSKTLYPYLALTTKNKTCPEFEQKRYFEVTRGKDNE